MIKHSLKQAIKMYVRGQLHDLGLLEDMGLDFNLPLIASIEPTIGDTTTTFSRSTTATVVDFEGVVHTTQINEARFPGARRVENRLTDSSNLLNWSSAVNITDTGETIEAPDGSIVKVFSMPIDSYALDYNLVQVGSSYVNSIWIKSDVETTIGFRRPTGIADSFNITITTEWQKFEIPGTCNAALTTVTFLLDNRTISGFGTYDINIAIWDAQQEHMTGTQTGASEAVSVGTLSYPYHGAGVDGVKYFTTDRDGNSLTDLPGYLNEPNGTNLVVYSNDFTVWTASGGATASGNQAIAPNGLLEADLISIPTSLGSIFTGITPTAGAIYTYSIYLRSVSGTGIVTLNWYDTVAGHHRTPVNITEEWQRFEITFTLSIGATHLYAYVGDDRSSTSTISSYYAWGAQVEFGLGSTSHIPTYGSTATRTADSLEYDVFDVITQGQGSMFCEFAIDSTQSSDYRLLYLSDGTASNMIYMYINSDGKISGTVVNSDVTVGSIESSVVTVQDTTYKVLLTYEDDHICLYVNGELIGSDTSGSIPMLSTAYLNVGSSYGGSDQMIGCIRNVKDFNQPLTEAQAIRITS